jgi:hypothetical protein
MVQRPAWPAVWAVAEAAVVAPPIVHLVANGPVALFAVRAELNLVLLCPPLLIVFV